MRSPRVTRSSSSPSTNGARRPPSVEAWARPAHPVHSGTSGTSPRAFGCGCTPFYKSSIHARPPGTRLQRNVGSPPPRSPSRHSQVVVGQRWLRQTPRGSSTRSSLQSIAMGRRAQCPPSIRRMQVSRARPSRIAPVELTAVDGSLLHHQRSLHPPPYPSISTPHQPSHHHSPTSAVTGSPLPTHTPPLLAGCVRVLTRPVGLGQVPAW